MNEVYVNRPTPIRLDFTDVVRKFSLYHAKILEKQGMVTDPFTGYTTILESYPLHEAAN